MSLVCLTLVGHQITAFPRTSEAPEVDLIVSGSDAQARISLALDTYLNAGSARVSEALAQAGLDREAAKELRTHGRLWADLETGDNRRRRRLTVALFALELADQQMQDSWRDVRQLVEWACTLLREDTPSESERLWQLAAMSLAHGARDWNFLVTPPREFAAGGRVATPTGLRGFDHLKHVQERFPHDTELEFAGVLAHGLRANPFWRRTPRPEVRAQEPAHPTRDPVLRNLTAFADDPTVGGEANLWVGLTWLLQYERPAEALSSFEVAGRSTDSFVAYLAHYAAGRVHGDAGHLASAEALYRKALAIRPGTQSAVLSLAALLFKTGETDEAYELMDPSLWRKAPPDPFQLYGFGYYRRFDDYLRRLRHELRP